MEPRPAARIELEAAAGAARRLLREAPSSADRYFKLAAALRALGYLDPARSLLRRAVALDPVHLSASELLATVGVELERRNDDLRELLTVCGLRIQKGLGIGWEGAVFLAEEPTRRRSWVVKVFHPHIIEELNGSVPLLLYGPPVGRGGPGLERLSRALANCGPGCPSTLQRFELIEDGGSLIGLRYPFEPLSPLTRIHLRYRRAQLALLGAFLRTQAFLLETTALCLVDGSRSNFMVSRHGHLRMVDYGTSLIPMDDFRCQEEQWQVVGLLRVLSDLWWPAMKGRAFGVAAADLDDLREGVLARMPPLPVLRLLVEALRTPNQSLLLDTSFYACAAADLPRRLPPWVVLAGKLESTLRRTGRALSPRS